MGKPFSILKNIDELKTKATAYETWAKKTRAEKSGLYQTKVAATGNARNARALVDAFLYPFDYKMTDLVVVTFGFLANPGDVAGVTGVESASQLIADVRKALLGDTVKFVQTDFASLEDGAVISAAKNSRLAKVTLTEIGAKVTTDGANVSRITGATYTYRKRDSISSPFGQNVATTGTQTFGEAKAVIKAALGPTRTRKVSFRPQGDLGITAK